MAAPLIVRLVMDAAGYLKTVDTAVASNTKLEQSSLGVGEAMQVSATKSVQASLRATEAVQTQVAGHKELAASALGVGDAVSVSAEKQVAASLTATRVLETQIAGQRALAADATKSAAIRTRANLLADRTQARLNSSLGLSSAALAGTSRGAQTAERDLGKTTRGLIAGSGAASGLGRSLAFASTGFIAVAAGATILKSSIQAALALAATQRQVDAQLKTTGKSWDQYGTRIDATDLKLSHVSGFTNQELLQSFGYLVRVTGNVSEALKLNATAADVARGRHITLSAASIALGKALGGSETALKRLGIVIPKTLDRMQALTYVQQKFAGQAAAGATVGDRFHASLVDTEEIIGTALLPTFTRLTTEISNWLAKMNETGRLQRDVNEAVSVGGDIFHALGAAIGVVDKATGSFGNTLKILFGVLIARSVTKAVLSVDSLAASWFGVAGAANAAAVAEERAAAVGVGAGIASGAGSAVAAARAAGASRVFAVSSAGEAEIVGIGGAAGLAATRVASLRGALLGLAGKTFITTLVLEQVLTHQGFLQSQAGALGGHLGANQPNPANPQSTQTPGPLDFFKHPIRTFFTSPALNDAASKLANQISDAVQKQIARNLSKGRVAPSFFPKDLRFAGVTGGTKASAPPGPFGTATPIAVYAKYTQTITEQLAVAQAALTKTTKDDVNAAKRIIARIKRLIDQGHLQGAALVQALQDEATQQGVLDNARQAAAAQAAKIAAAKQAAASTYATPIDLQLAEARAQLTKSTADDIRAERQILAAAKAALNSGKKNKQGQLAALQVMLQAQQAIQSFNTQANSTFTLPLKLQLALAKAQALGTDQTKILLKMKAALERALKGAKGNIQKQIDIWNQIASINQQLGSSVTGILGNFKQASTRVLTAGLGLTPAQRKALRARLSQLGPGGTVPGGGVGAGGFIIDPATGRPIRPGHGGHAGGGGGRGAVTDGAKSAALDKAILRLSSGKAFKQHITVVVELDGKQIASSTTTHQQKRRARNPSQRRGPNAGN